MRTFHFEKSRLNQILIDGKLTMKKLDLNVELSFGDLLSSESQCIRKVDIENIRCAKISFAKLRVCEGVRIVDSQIDELEFHYCVFELSENEIYSFFINAHSVKKISFNNCIFEGKADFQVNDFAGEASFEECVFRDDLLFSNFNVRDNGKISLSSGCVLGNCIFRFFQMTEGELDIRSDIKGELHFFEINTRLEERDWTRSKLSIEGQVAVSCVRFFKCKIGVVNVVNAMLRNVFEQHSKFMTLMNDAARTFRDAAVRNNEEILSIKYTGEVYDRYLKEETVKFLRKCSARITNDKTTINLPGWVLRLLTPLVIVICSIFSSDRFLLCLNKYSNDFNRSWVRGVCFTFITAIGFYFALNYWGMETPYFVVEFHFKNFGQVLLGFISIIDVTDWTDTKDLFDLTPTGKVILFFAKLAVSYGIWQTIYAFYKFKRQ